MWHVLKSSNWNILTPHDAHHCRSPGSYFSLVFCLWFSLRLRRCNKSHTNQETCRRHPAMFHLVSELRSEFRLLLDSGWIHCLIKYILMRIKRNTIQCRKAFFFVSSRKKGFDGGKQIHAYIPNGVFSFIRQLRQVRGEISWLRYNWKRRMKSLSDKLESAFDLYIPWRMNVRIQYRRW